MVLFVTYNCLFCRAQRNKKGYAISMFGHYVKDLNRAYITSVGKQTISLVNDEGVALKTYPTFLFLLIN